MGTVSSYVKWLSKEEQTDCTSSGTRPLDAFIALACWALPSVAIHSKGCHPERSEGSAF
jgi:hypothetical protein